MEMQSRGEVVMYNSVEYAKLVEQRIKESEAIYEEAEKKYLEAKSSYEETLRQKDMFLKWVKEGIL